MKLSVSNLAWRNVSPSVIGPRLKECKLQGVEVAPTLVWPEAPKITKVQAQKYFRQWDSVGLRISGIQSLLHGHPELQVFDVAHWPKLYSHLEAMLLIARELETNVAVFGSPKNRVRGQIPHLQAAEIFSEFLMGFIPVLAEYGVVLTLEPNAPDYGADFLTTYKQVVEICDTVDSKWVKPQIDTGCMYLVDDDVVEATAMRTPSHVHVSMPELTPPPGRIEHERLRDVLQTSTYNGWLVLEMMASERDSLEATIQATKWLSNTYLADLQ
jgi:D-psicose/D-tagatose/L-ribulose 3-epimerase